MLAAVAGWVLLLGCGSTDNRAPSVSAAKEAVAEYLVAVELEDQSAISALVAPGVDASADISERLALYGGRRVNDVSVRYTSDLGGLDVEITDTTASGTDRMEKLVLVAEDNEWYVALGQARQSRPSASSTPP